MKCRQVISVILMTICVGLFSPIGVKGAGAGPWHWVMTLRQPKIKDAMINPTALYIDERKKNYYVVDSGKNRLLSFDNKGELLHIFTAGNDLDLPMDMVRTSDGGIWVVEKGRNSLSLIDLKEKRIIRHQLRAGDEKIYPHRVEVLNDFFYVLDKRSGDVIKFDISLNYISRFGCSDCEDGFIDFKVDSRGVLALTVDKGGLIYEFSLDGAIRHTIPLNGLAMFPVSLCQGPSGYFYVLDRHNSKVLVFDRGGEFKYSFLEFGSSQGQLYYPIEIRFDPWGRICVVEEGNARVEVFAR